MKSPTRILPLVILVIAAGTGNAQQRPPIRQLGAVTAKSAEAFTNVASVRALSSGAILVNDLAGRRVVMFDPKLSSITIVADSTSATGNAYSGRVGNLIAYRGDSSLFVDPTSVSMLVIDPAGKVARVMAIPRAEDAAAIGSPFGSATYDPAGRLVYRSMGFGGVRFGGPGGRVQIQSAPSGAARTGPPPMPDIPDSAFIVAVNLATRKVDTVGYIRTPKVKMEVQQNEGGGFRMQSMLNPLPVIDDWTVTPDGAVAIVRGRDYHVDWINPDGTKASSAKIPFDWQRLTDEDKIAFIDSVKAARERAGANAPLVAGGVVPQGGGGAGGPQVMIFQGGPGGGQGGPQRDRAGAQPNLQVSFVPPSELPDYKPAFFANSTRADNDGNLWIRTIPTSAVPGGPVYDVINRKGEIVERVQIPENRTIIGFGSGGSVFLLNRQGATATIEKASVR